MRQMKDSGIEWIGQIPEEWEMRKISHIFQQRLEKGSDSNILLAATQQRGIIPQSEIEGVVRVREDTDLQSFKTVKMHDYVISLRSFQGGIEYSQYDGVCSPAYQVFFNTRKINHIFFKYLFKSEGFISKINSLTVGIRDGKNIQYDELKTVFIPSPPLDEQQRIADYLDAQCARIDETMELVRQSKEKLRAYKLSLITEAVTKGLDPDVPMKDSGIPWIGGTPATWYFEKLKNLFSFEKGKEAQKYTKEYIGLNNGEFPVYSGQTENNGIMGKISSYDYDIKECIFTTTVGAKVMSAKILSGKFSLSQNCLIMLPKGNFVNVKFIYYLLIVLFEYEKSLIPAYMQPSLRISDLSTYSFYVPNTYFEQQRIAAYLDEKCARIDALLAEKDELLDKLAEYRKSLIFECVTGKREVAA